MSQKVLVTGANDKTGRAVIAALAKKGASVRAFVRKVEQGDALKALGAAEIALGDMNAVETIAPALKGCDAIVHIGPPMHPDEKAMTEHFIKAAQAIQLPRFIYYSVMHPLRREVPHHARKLDTEEMLIESGQPYTIINPTRYMQHLEMIWKDVVANGVHGMPFNTHVKFNIVDLLDLAEVTAKVTAEDGHLWASYELAGPEGLSQDDMAAIISEVLKKPVTARQVPLDEMEAKARAGGATDQRIDTMRKMNTHYDHGGFRGNANILRWVLGREPTRFKEYVTRLAKRDGLLA